MSDKGTENYYRLREEGWLAPDDVEDAKNWRRLKHNLGCTDEVTYDGVLTKIRRWRAWAAAVEKGVLAPIEAEDVPQD
jgi:hypothetical protein